MVLRKVYQAIRPGRIVLAIRDFWYRESRFKFTCAAMTRNWLDYRIGPEIVSAISWIA